MPLAGLDPGKRKAASFEWDGKEWRGWNYFGFPSVTKPGLRLEQMDAAQKDLAWALLATLMSSGSPPGVSILVVPSPATTRLGVV